jgi:nucleoside-diphosphate-sugar epimerase
MQLVLTGACGFLGGALREAALRAWPEPEHRFVLVDRQFKQASRDRRVIQIEQNLSDLPALERLAAEADVIFHLAAIPGGAAEHDFELSRQVNLNASLALLDFSRRRPTGALRFIYASSIAVFGEPLPPEINDQTVPRPTMTYGAHKLMVETELANLTRLGRLDGWALRLPGLVARPEVTTGLKSAFLSELFHACAQRRAFSVPMSPEATVWLMSADCAACNLIRAAKMTDNPAGMPRAITLPALRVTIRELVAAVCRQSDCAAENVTYQPDEAIEAQFGRLPPLATGFADQLGFRHDGNLDRLVKRAFVDAGYSS